MWTKKRVAFSESMVAPSPSTCVASTVSAYEEAKCEWEMNKLAASAAAAAAAAAACDDDDHWRRPC
jgi:hypothetical protein